MYDYKVHACKVHARKAYDCKMDAYKMHVYQMHAYKVVPIHFIGVRLRRAPYRHASLIAEIINSRSYLPEITCRSYLP
jgi:hypothetical protein